MRPDDVSTAPKGFAGWRMVAIGFLAQNCAGGMVLGTFGTVLVLMQADLGVNRAAISSVLGIIYLSLCLSSPLVGNLLQRVSLRKTMLAGAAIAAIASTMLAYADSFLLVACICALILGPAMCMLGIIPTSTLISRWFERDRGKALGIANMPLFLLIIPPIAAEIAIGHGRRGVFLSVAAAFLLLMVLLWRVVERPELIGQQSRRDGTALPVSGQAGIAMSASALLGDTRFWLLSLAIGIMAGGGTIFLGHAVPMAQQQGYSLAASAMLMSGCGAGTLAGAILFGWLIDRTGALTALTINALVQAAAWFGLLFASSLFELVALSAIMGSCYGAQIALHGAALNDFFGAPTISRAMGFSYLLKVPFMFGAAPLAGYIFDLTGNYDGALILCGTALAISMLLFGWLRFQARDDMARKKPNDRPCADASN